MAAGWAQDTAVPGQPRKHSGWGRLCCPFPSLSLVLIPLLAEGSIWTRPQLSWPQYLGAGLAAVQALGVLHALPHTCAGSTCCPLPHRGSLAPVSQGDAVLPMSQ